MLANFFWLFYTYISRKGVDNNNDSAENRHGVRSCWNKQGGVVAKVGLCHTASFPKKI